MRHHGLGKIEHQAWASAIGYSARELFGDNTF
jgi:hypothetical protein